jgi:hypothetical protein
VSGRSLALLEDSLERAGAEINRTSLTIVRQLPFEQYEALCRTFGMFSDSVAWWLGDLLLYGEGA